ncbi:alpha/beta hydrolase [Rhodococcoides fascians]|jgi:enterochelin esterase-like enzyme|nr:alpha/beta hydrolase-fold protein [Rhodococcus fascians]WQH28021.1 alpha/beta hydrolase-fold protein [Rhodococcus fascians]
MSIIDVQLLSGTVGAVLLGVGVVGLLALAAGRGRRWWCRRLPAALLIGAGVSAILMVSVNVLWRPFPDPLPAVAVLWTGLGAAAVAMAVLRSARLRGRALSVMAVACVVISGAAQVNQHFGAYPTVRSALGLKLASQVDFSQVPGHTSALTLAQPALPLSQSWLPPQAMPSTGIVSTVTIAGSVSGFAAREAWIYLPPAYLSVPRAQLPVLVLVPGQPGTPRDWFDGGTLDVVLDSYAGAHAGLAPIVVVADPLGSQLAQTLCVDSPAGNAFTYLSVDVPAWIRSTLQVDPDPRHWAVGGMSAGGTCALQLAVNAPTVYPTFLDISGQDEPTVGTRRQTVTQFFGGDPAAFAAVNPVDVLARTRLPDTAGTIVAGSTDRVYGPQAQRVLAATTAAGVDVRYLELPGGHSWSVWGPGLSQSLPWLGTRLGLTP